MNILGLLLIVLAIWLTWMTLSTAWTILVGLVHPEDEEHGRRARISVFVLLMWAAMAVGGWFLLSLIFRR